MQIKSETSEICPFDYSVGGGHGDPQLRVDLARARKSAREVQAVEREIAPGCRLRTFDGRLLAEGQEVKIEDVAGSRHWLDHLVAVGCVSEIPADLAARRRPSPGREYKVLRAISMPAPAGSPPEAIGGVRGPGEYVGPIDFAQPARAGVEAIAEIRDPNSQQLIMSGRSGHPARPATDGTEAFPRLLRLGLVAPIERTVQKTG